MYVDVRAGRRMPLRCQNSCQVGRSEGSSPCAEQGSHRGWPLGLRRVRFVECEETTDSASPRVVFLRTPHTRVSYGRKGAGYSIQLTVRSCFPCNKLNSVLYVNSR